MPLIPTPSCDYGHPALETDTSCTTCDHHRIARCKPGYLDKLAVAAVDDSTAKVIYADTIASIDATARRLYWGFVNGDQDGLSQLALISKGHQLLTAVQGHTALDSDTQDAIYALFAVTTAVGSHAGIEAPDPQLV